MLNTEENYFVLPFLKREKNTSVRGISIYTQNKDTITIQDSFTENDASVIKIELVKKYSK